ncbi:hypothetical protein VOLCADRAFT_107016 [Volvox carteri f. nagariensis]|uniref:TatD related DNase n=1 Tax=Volvox carteri f. nagariensis TaxID=3068 RepID=D8UBC0_VOLCA|nr:uncharacterized protein VOLCADRAFT_107016 [Volvox carteri f. nagariensis]EFJ42922.1 hypothetical protein VOLCADRAFT_107016 [Volvox carteri f. nagariensis]|eukprot:XP_002955962.1 hypothetical protein VOLCADRAFT_107016 [Volvox carteri f. nagariensis]
MDGVILECDGVVILFKGGREVGLHCSWSRTAAGCNNSTLGELRRLVAHPRCVAVGECGLDFNRNFSPPEIQVEAGVRDAGERFAEILSRHMPLPPAAVVHCFTGSRRELETFLELGLYIGITGWPSKARPGRNEPALLPHVLQAAATAMGISSDEEGASCNCNPHATGV